jgi:riboflavin kinase/FMN adenylyltransferase
LSFSTISERVTNLAIGTFDGFHRGHRELFRNLDSDGAILIIEKSYPNYLLPKEFKSRFVEQPIYYYQLSEIMKLNGVEFIDLLLSNFPKLQKIVVGYDFHFGYNRNCLAEDLKRVFRGDVHIVDEVQFQNISVHSKAIRELLEGGDIEMANRFLNRNYSIIGNRVKGQGIGSRELVPTINLSTNSFFLPKSGVYSSRTVINGFSYKSISFLGHRYTTDGELSLETHILESFEECRSDEIEVQFIEFIRENRKFKSLSELKKQIERDILSIS